MEPQQDGVGDYTRKLAYALISRGHAACIIAINDRHMSGDSWEGKQKEDNIEIDILRLSHNLPWETRLNLSKNFADNFNPNWLSLQFVPFGYQIKGLPFKLDKKLKYISKHARWHVMFHELSVNKNESLKFGIWAFLQLKIISSLLNGLKPTFITTNTQVYQQILQKLGYKSFMLPLFSNIEYLAESDVTAFTEQIPNYLLSDRLSCLVGTLFGTFSFKSWNLHSLLNKLVKQYPQKRILITSVGKMSTGASYWKTLKNQYPSVIFLELGMRDAAFISFWLSHYTDFGILTTFPELAGKSGSFMAFKEHGIPVFCKEPEEQLQKYHIKLDNALTVVTSDSESLQVPQRVAPISLLNDTVNQFIKLLNYNE